MAHYSSRTIDWRTLDPSTIEGEGIPVEELRFYQEKLDELLEIASGRYVLIVGREIVSYFDDLDSAASFAAQNCEGRTVLIKKIVASEPIHSLGGGLIESIHSTEISVG